MESSQNQKTEFYQDRGSWFRQAWIRYLFFFLIGVGGGALLVYLVGPDTGSATISDDQVRGTIYNSNSFDQMKPADPIVVNQPNLEAGIQVRYASQMVEARIELNTTGPVKLLVGFSPSDFRVMRVLNMTVGNQSGTLSARNYVQIDNIGEGKYIVQWANLNRLPHEITFRFLEQDMPIYTNSVTVNKEL
jgi:hypothetical protein